MVALAFIAGSVTANAGIIGTAVNVGMEIRYDPGNVVDASASDFGVTSASVSILGDHTGASAFSRLEFAPLGAETAVFNFALGYDANNFAGTGYMGETASGSNRGTLSYDASVDTLLDYSWAFDYLGPNPFGLQIVRVRKDGLVIQELGNAGLVGHHAGTDSLLLPGGSTYDFDVVFYPNVFNAIGSVEGRLEGSVSFDFAPVPEPATMALVAGGLLPLALRRRRRP